MTKLLTELQMRIMEILWDVGEASVSEVQDSLMADRRLARTTVATLLSRLEAKGVLSKRAREREQVYAPLISQEEVRRSIVRTLMDRGFGGSIPSLVKQLLGSEEIDPEDLAEIRRMLVERENDLARRKSTGDDPERSAGG